MSRFMKELEFQYTIDGILGSMVFRALQAMSFD